ncbi:ClpXP protease specificity-enhancing factor [Aestuariibacter salexigens]|uniref:ClpXP protease specificity-enhancing factor n=1 Tax=Aestuariibacter salexigens TaxID=226010 RepID=UPI00047BAD35|nr:ClpXP protease specificity-enhancing factor [Aestuariibacter salexigens]
MTSNQPYLLRAFYEWIVDNNLTPYIVVDATKPGVEVPEEHIRNGQIVLNVSPSACANLLIGNIDVTFEARFGGVARQLVVPIYAVLAIYARENGAGTVFAGEEEMSEPAAHDLDQEDVPSTPSQAPKPAKKGKPTLKVIK